MEHKLQAALDRIADLERSTVRVQESRFTIARAAAMINVTVPHMRKLARKSRWAHKPFGGHWEVDRQAFLAAMAERIVNEAVKEQK